MRKRRPSLLASLGSSFGWGWLTALSFTAFFVLWEYSIDWFSVPRYILPKPSEIVTKAWADWPILLWYTWVTGIETVIGYAVALVIAVPLGLAIAFSRILRATIYPSFVSLEMTPKIAFAPIFVSWLGFGLLPKVIIVFLVCFFPIVLNAILAFSSLSEELTRFCRSTGAGPLRAFIKVRLPAALPNASSDSNMRPSTPRSARRSRSSSAPIRASASTSRSRPATCGRNSPSRRSSCSPSWASGSGLVTLAERLLIPWDISQRRLTHL